MLVLGMNKGEGVRFFDKEKDAEIGRVIRLKPRQSNPAEILFGFDFNPSIQIVRDSLLNRKRKDTENGSERHP